MPNELSKLPKANLTISVYTQELYLSGIVQEIFKKVLVKEIPGPLMEVLDSNSISGIRRYKYWPTICTPRILLFRSEIQVQIRK